MKWGGGAKGWDSENIFPLSKNILRIYLGFAGFNVELTVNFCNSEIRIFILHVPRIPSVRTLVNNDVLENTFSAYLGQVSAVNICSSKFCVLMYQFNLTFTTSTAR